MPFWAYMLHCRGGVFYTGYTDDLERRIGAHQSGLIPGFTQSLLPVELVWSQQFTTRDEALSAERQIKGWSRRKKLALIRGDWEDVSRLAKGKDHPSTSSGRTELWVARSALADMQAHAARAMRNEACGILLGRDGRIEHALSTANVAADPTCRFEIDPAALIAAHRASREGGWPVIGYYHSHPDGLARPSAIDCALAAHDDAVWAIVGGNEINFWRDGTNGFVALSYTLADG